MPFPPEITLSKRLELLGQGITDIEIHFLHVKFTAIGVYLDKQAVTDYLLASTGAGKWKGAATEADLLSDTTFFQALVSAPGKKLLRVAVIKEIKGSQYGEQLETVVRDRLAEEDRYEDPEEEALEKVSEFFRSKYFSKGSIVTFAFPDVPLAETTVEITFATEGKPDAKIAVDNHNVAEKILTWYMGGSRAVSPSTTASLANRFAEMLSSSS